MNATSLYVTTSRLVLQQSHDCTSDQNWTDLYRLVPYLRQSLSCTVCGRMLIEPYKPSDGKCQHHICRGCVRGRKNLKPTCCWCRDNYNLEKYEENTQMRILLQCYKSLCQYIMNTPMYQIISKQTNTSGTTNLMSNGVAIPNASLMEFIEEGACFQDNFKSNSGLTKSAYSILPCVFNQPSTIPSSSISPQQQQQQQHQQVQTSTILQRQQSPLLLTTTPTPSPPNTTPSPSNQQYQQVLQIHQKSANNPNNNNIGKNLQQQTAHSPLSISNNLTTTSTSGISTTTTTTNINSSKIQGKIQNLTATSSISSSATNQLISQQQQLQNNNNNNNNNNSRNVINVLPPPASIEPKINAIVSAPTVQLSNPPPIKTVSNGSAMYSVLYTGIGNKITIKRKTDGDDDSSAKKYANLPPPPARPIVNNKTTVGKRRGCRCGNATATPGKLTCCGQRCPCYVDSKSCIDCKCRGCRNPHRPDGGKIRPMIPELACYEIQMADENTNMTTAATSTAAAAAALGSTITTQPFNQLNLTTNNYGTQSNIPNISSSHINNNNNNSNNKLNRMEISLEDFNSTNLSNLIGSSNNNNNNNNSSILSGMVTTAITTTPSPSIQTTTNNSATHHVIPILKKPQQTTTYAFTTNQINRIQSSQQQSQHQQHQQQTVKLENTSRESLLIKSADGKYQVVNVYTTTPHQTTNHQRYHTIQTSTINNLQHNNNTISGLQLHQRNINQTSLHQIPEISTTLPQLLLQPQQQQQQQQQQQLNNSNTTLLTTSNDLNSFHQQTQNLNNFITSHNQQQQHQQQLQSTPTTITLSPIIVTTPTGTFPAELFNDDELPQQHQSTSHQLLEVVQTTDNGEQHHLSV